MAPSRAAWRKSASGSDSRTVRTTPSKRSTSSPCPKEVRSAVSLSHRATASCEGEWRSATRPSGSTMMPLLEATGDTSWMRSDPTSSHSLSAMCSQVTWWRSRYRMSRLLRATGTRFGSSFPPLSHRATCRPTCPTRTAYRCVLWSIPGSASTCPTAFNCIST